jgi:hypothetical protein
LDLVFLGAHNYYQPGMVVALTVIDKAHEALVLGRVGESLDQGNLDYPLFSSV